MSQLTKTTVTVQCNCGHAFQTNDSHGADCPECEEYIETLTPDYLMDLAERLWHTAAIHTDQADCERLRQIAGEMRNETSSQGNQE